MKEQLFAIGKMAEINHISISALRLYDKKGLLKPAYVDGQTGYRYYTLQQTVRLDIIAYMKEMGMSLAEIKNVLEQKDISLIEAILGKKNEQLHEQIRQLKERHEAVMRAISSIERYRKSPTTGTIALEYIDQRYIWSIPCSINFYEKDSNSFEEIIRELRRALIEAGIPQVHSYNMGTSIRLEDYKQERFIADKVFILSDRKLLDYPGTVSRVESGMYACIYLDSYDQEISYGKNLLDFCKRQKYILCGDYLCEELTEFNIFDSNRRNMFLKLQVPIKFSNSN